MSATNGYPTTPKDQYYLQLALNQAKQALEEDEVPIGAIIVSHNQILAKGYNQTERLKDPTAHAEMIAITAACNALGSKYLRDCTLYVTVEPCLMCAGAIIWSQVSRLVFGTVEPKYGYRSSKNLQLHPKTVVHSGLMANEAAELMKIFFQSKR